MTLDEWLGHDNQIGKDIWTNKYRFKDETFDEWINRISGGNKNIAELIRQNSYLAVESLRIEDLRIKVGRSACLTAM